jgi:hypothetical protein
VKLVDWIERAAQESGLEVQRNFTISFPDSEVVTSLIRVADIGGRNGMLIFNSYDALKTHAKELIEAGYGYSMMDEPSDADLFDLIELQEMFVEWGWHGNSAV